MRVLIACEYSATVRDAFERRGHFAVSCDLLPSERPGKHIQGNVLDYLDRGWDLLIAHPPCQYLANSGVSWLRRQRDRWIHMLDAALLFNALYNAPVSRVCVENPIPHKYARALIGDYTQLIQPFQYGHLVSKATCLWLRNLPPLQPTHDRSAEYRAQPRDRTHWLLKAGPSPDRAKERARFFSGVASAMADQWGLLDD